MPDHWYRIVNQDDSATIDIYDEISQFGISAKNFVADLRDITAKTIKLHINSPGGLVDDGIAIYNALKAHPANVEVHVDAMAASIASVIAMAGDRVIMAPHSRMMIHNAMAAGGGIAVGFADDWERVASEATKVAENLRETSAQIASIYAERTGKEAAYWQSKMDAETRFSDQQAVDEGLADEVGRDYQQQDFRIAANWDWTRFSTDSVAVRNELLEVVEPESNAGRTMSQANLDRMHESIAGLMSVHNATCDMGEQCPMYAPEARGGGEEHASESDAEWTPAYINDLPDSAFAYVEPGGEKDDQGKTVPRSLRHFPHHDAQGAVDLPHLRNAMARAPQSPFGDQAMAHLRRHADSEGVGDEEREPEISKEEARRRLVDQAIAARRAREAVHA